MVPSARTDRALCPACDSPDTEIFLVRRSVPVNQNTLFPDPESARSVSRGTLQMTVCRACGFVFNRAFDAAKLRYDDTYDNNQTCSHVFTKHVDDLVSYLLRDEGLEDVTIVEVGCGKGYFLERLVAGSAKNRGIGFDPTYLGPLVSSDGRLQFERTFYGRHSRDVTADVLVCRHVIEHVPDPFAMLSRIRESLTASPHAKVYFETPCVEWILRNGVFWDFFYEHCSLFTRRSLTALFHRSGFEVLSVRHVFDGQYLWLEARPGDTGRSAVDASEIVCLAESFAPRAEAAVTRLRRRISDLQRDGQVAIWGAGAKGVTCAYLVDENRELVDCLVDLNPRKQGHFVPASAHPIVGYDALANRNVRSALVMNPNYLGENRDLLDALGLRVRLYVDEMATP